MENHEQMPKENHSIVTLGDWVITLLLMIIPLVNIILLFVWAFSSNTATSKANWAKAQLIFALVAIVLMIIFWGAFAALLFH